MTGPEDDIEYLEEDADLVQQYVQLSQGALVSVPEDLYLKPRASQRVPTKKRKRKEQESDSEYDPSEEEDDEEILRGRGPTPAPPRKRKQITRKPRHVEVITPRKKQTQSAKEKYLERKKLKIRIPDYEDPLCLPVRALVSDENVRKRLKNWNNVCLEHFKYCDAVMKPDRGDCQKTVKTTTFRNVYNNKTGNWETSLWSKICVENPQGDKKSEVFQSILPRYKEKKVLSNFLLGQRKSSKNHHVVDEVILSKEQHEGEDALVVYKNNEALVSIYTEVDLQNKEDEETQNDDTKRYLQEVVCTKACPPCFQSSWRGTPTEYIKLLCPICGRVLQTPAEFVAHCKRHDAKSVRMHRQAISDVMAEVVPHNYKCRICRLKCENVKRLRQHVLTHITDEVYTCEIGNHPVNAADSLD